MENILYYSSIVIVIVTWIYFKIVNNVLKQQDIVHEAPLPVVGNLLSVINGSEGAGQLLERLYIKFSNEKLFGIFGFLQKPAIIVTDPEFIKKITIKDFNHFVNHDNNHDMKLGKYFDKSVLQLRDEKWKEVRSILSPIFSSAKMKFMFGLLTESVEKFINFHEKKAKANGWIVDINTFNAFGRVTTDGISTAALGFEGDCVENEDSEMFKITEQMEKDFVNSSMQFLFYKVYNFFGIEMFHKKVQNFFERNVLGELKRRIDGNISRPDVIQLMIQNNQGQNGRSKKILSDDEMIAQVLVLFLGGFDTTTALMQGISFELAKNPKVQQNLIDEVDEILNELNGKKISYEQLNNMKYLEMVVNEGLRMWTPTRLNVRNCNKDYDLIDDETGKTYKIKKGTDVFIPVGALHNDPKYYPKPEEFNPERFNADNKNNAPFMPFGNGPRLCIGSRFSLLESKLLLFNIMSKFRFEKCSKTPANLTPSKGVGFSGEIFLRMNLRK